MNQKRTCPISAFLMALLLSVPLNANAALVLVTSRVDLDANDAIDWGFLGPAGTIVDSPFIITSTLGLDATVSQPTGQFQTRYQCSDFPSCDLPAGWHGTFGYDDNLLFTNRPNLGPISISFSSAVQGLGAQINSADDATFKAFLKVYSPTDVLLGSFNLNGSNLPFYSNGTAAFLGVYDTDGATIGRIEYYVERIEPPHAAERNPFAINQLSIRY